MKNPNSSGQPDMNYLLQMLAAKAGKNPQELQQQLSRGDTAELLSSMDPASRQTAEKVLADPALAQKMLQTPQVRELLQRLMGGGK